ncbi:MAG: glycogen debranching enzyme N-terminal domain-containing protein [Bacteroidetes bacterium]|nr:glycogen debranching enzyme N-terminal domain-containing protein [Bacteroidota bacterium]
MSYIDFDKLQLINLQYSLTKELLRSDRAGAYSSTSIIGCNTRKYHGLLIVRQPNLDGQHHVLLSTVDETIIQQESDFNFGIHRYKGGYYNPKGHKYIRDFTTEPIPKLTFRVGGVFLTKEMLFTHDEARVIIKYTLQDAHSPTVLRLKPFLAFRNHHSLSKNNIFADTKYEPIKNGIKMRMYEGYSPLYLQLSKKDEYVHVPHWYYDIEYIEELERGYEYLEDLFVPGFFEVALKKGESIYFSAGLAEVDPAELSKLYKKEVSCRIPRNTFKNCLINSAHQFIQKNDDKTGIIAGFPWYERRYRDTLIALPGLTLADGRVENFKAVFDSVISEMQGPIFPGPRSDKGCQVDSADSQLWLFWALQQYVSFSGKKLAVWKEYGNKLKEILAFYRQGNCAHLRMTEEGLIEAFDHYRPLTWMDAIVDGKLITPRHGKAVEVNALWYNAVMFTLELAKAGKDTAFIAELEPLANQIPASFIRTFWDESRGYLADVVQVNKTDWSVRPNQVFATSLPYSPLDEIICKKILDKVQSELLTPRGLRSLSPKDPNYVGVYQGNQASRDLAAHQGSVWPWLISHFAEGFLKIHGKQGLPFINKLLSGFEPVMREHGIGSVSEVYDGDPPHRFGGAISMAWSVSELLRLGMIIEQYENLSE